MKGSMEKSMEDETGGIDLLRGIIGPFDLA
jgi:hypothetical protein